MELSWILLGMMGSGKTTIGRCLANISGREFLDTDLLVEKRIGRSVQQVFKIYTEQAFRDHETSILRSLQPGPTVVSTGGGIVIRPENWIELRRLGTTIYLKASAETIISRLEFGKKKRPLLAVDDWQSRVRQLLKEREHLYSQADIVVDLDVQGVDKAVDLVFRAIQTHEDSAS